MRIVLVHDWLTGMRGGEKCLEAVGRHFPRAPLLTLLHRRGAVSPIIEALDIRTSPLQLLPGVARYYRSLLPLMPAAMARLAVPPDAEVVLSFSHAIAKAVRVPLGVPHICYCFTPMRYAWHRRDDYLAAPGATIRGGRSALQSPVNRLSHFALDRLRQWDRRSERSVTQFLAVSHTVARRIRDCYGRESRVIYPPVDTEFYTPHGQRREDFYLCVSALAPYKRVDLAIEACRRLKRKLVVIGAGPELKRLKALAPANTVFRGWATNEVIRDHLRRCRALVFPGHEDFGIVPVEAQACGTPVAAFGEGGATESVLPADDVRVGTGVFFAEQSVDSLCTALQWLEAHPEACDATLARRQATRFSADRYVAQMLGMLNEATSPASSTTRIGQFVAA